MSRSARVKGEATLGLRQKMLRLTLCVILTVGLMPSFAWASEWQGVDTDLAYVEADLGLTQWGGNGPAAQRSDTSLLASADVEGAKAALLAGFDNVDAEIDLSAYNIPFDDIKQIAFDVIEANPQFFYVKTAVSYSGFNTVNTFYPTYVTSDKNQLATMRQQYEQRISEALTWMPSAGTTAEKLKAAHDWLFYNVEYDAAVAQGGTSSDMWIYSAYGAMVGGNAVCQGYALAFIDLCHRIGATAVFAKSDPMCHSWALVQLDGSWYHVDPTWDDPVWSGAKPADAKPEQGCFLKSTDAMNAAVGQPHYDWVPAYECNDTRYDGTTWKTYSEPAAAEEPEAQVVAYGTCGAYARWKLDANGLLTISGWDDLYARGDVYKLWGDYCPEIREVKIDSGITTICLNAFSGCTNLRKVTIPASVKQVFSGAFYNCTSLHTVVVEDLKAFLTCSYANNASSPCINYADVYVGDQLLTSATVPEGMTSVPYAALARITSLESVVIPEGVVSLGQYAFEGCSKLKTVTLPYSLVEIGKGAFKSCSSLTTVNYAGTKDAWTGVQVDNADGSNDPLITCKDWRYGEKTGAIASGSCGDGVTWELMRNLTLEISGTGSLSAYAYESWTEYRSKITAVVIKPGVTGVGAHAFEGMSSLTTITWAPSVASVGEDAFADCKVLVNVYIDDLQTYLAADFASAKGHPTYYCANLYIAGSRVTALSIPGTVKTVPDYAFTGCYYLTSIVVSEGVEQIGSKAFDFCKSMTTISLPKSLKSISADAFTDCKNLTKILYAGTQDEWTKLTKDTWLAESAIVVCSNSSNTVAEGTCGEDLTWKLSGSGGLSISGSGPMNNMQQGQAPWSEYTGDITSVTLSEGVTSVGTNAFSGCKKLSTVDLPEGVTSIGEGAFSDCTSMENAVIPSSVTFIGEGAYAGCKNLTDVYAAGGAEQIASLNGGGSGGGAGGSGGGGGGGGATGLEDADWYADASHIHEWTEGEYIAPTCEKGGSTVLICACGATKERADGTEALGHDWGEWAVSKSATCSEEGMESRSCKHDAFHAETRPVAKVDHTPEALPAVAPTCIEDGLTAGSRCSVCGEVLETQLAVPAKGHAVAVDAAVAATCEKAGLTEGKHCSVCGAVLEAQQAVPALQHSFTNYVSDGNATCEADGTKTAKCGRCGAADTVTDAGSRLGHDWGEWKVTKAATTSAEGEEARTCGNDPSHAETRAIPNLQPTASFPDVPEGAWYYKSVGRAVGLGVIKGYADGTFGPDDPLTRAQAATMLWRYYTGSRGDKSANTTGMPDVDVSQYYTAAANWAVENGVISGKTREDGTRYFDPNGSITREQLCVIVSNASRRFAGTETKGADRSAMDAMPDASSVSGWAQNAVAWALNAGVISGQNRGGVKTIDPQGVVTRAQMATILVRSIDGGLLG